MLSQFIVGIAISSVNLGLHALGTIMLDRLVCVTRSYALRPPRRERWTSHGKAPTEDEARSAGEAAWWRLCEAYGLKPAGP
jgi:hypothetical protein